MKRRQRTLHAVGLAVGLAAVPPAAYAHGTLAAGDFYAGMLHPVVHLDTLLPALSLALFAAQRRGPLIWQVPATFVGAAVLAGGWAAASAPSAPPTWLPLASALALGGLVAGEVPLPQIAALLLAATTGSIEGYASVGGTSGEVENVGLYLAGLAGGLSLLLFHLTEPLRRRRAVWVRVAVRVVGSWIAAAALMQLALSLAGPRTPVPVGPATPTMRPARNGSATG